MNRGERKLDRIILGRQGLGEIVPLCPNVAFEKGVEYFVEITCFYGVLLAMLLQTLHWSECQRIDTEASLLQCEEKRTENAKEQTLILEDIMTLKRETELVSNKLSELTVRIHKIKS